VHAVLNTRDALSAAYCLNYPIAGGRRSVRLAELALSSQMASGLQLAENLHFF